MIYPNLQIEMYRKGLTLSDLAAKMQTEDGKPVTVSTLSMKTNGKTRLTFADAAQIKDILDTSLTLEELFTRSDG